jgi:hypothetical protein
MSFWMTGRGTIDSLNPENTIISEVASNELEAQRKTDSERLKVVHADFVAKKMQQSILKHASVAISGRHISY